MPQLDQFPLLIHFKSFFFGFGFLYFFSILLVVPMVHGNLRTRKVFLSHLEYISILSQFKLINLNYMRVSILKRYFYLDEKNYKLFNELLVNISLLKFYKS